jgi:hypothetical protein
VQLSRLLTVRLGRALAASPAGRVLWPLLTAAGGLTAAALVGVVDPNEPGHYPTCPFLYLTGYYCPGCGSLRAVHAIVHGDLGQALDRNPLTVLFLPYLLWAWGSWLYRSVTGRQKGDLAPPWVVWSLLVAVIAFWALRNLPGFAWLAP